jgi:hypothetical protein
VVLKERKHLLAGDVLKEMQQDRNRSNIAEFRSFSSDV